MKKSFLFLAAILTLCLPAIAQITTSEAAKASENVTMRTGTFWSSYETDGKILVGSDWRIRGSGEQIVANTSGTHQNESLPVCVITGSIYHTNQFLNSDLTGATINATMTTDAYGQFQNANLTDALINANSSSQDTYKSANLTNAEIAGRVSGVFAFNEADLTNAKITATIGDGADGGSAAFMSANLTGTRIQSQFNTRASFWDEFMFVGSDLTNTNFTGSTGLRATYFKNATSLEGTILTGTGISRAQLQAQGISNAVLDTIVF